MNERTRDEGDEMFKIGDKVIIDPRVDPAGRYRGVIFTVKKVPTRANEVNYLLGRVGGGRDVKARASIMLPYDESGVTITHDTGTTTLTPYEPRLQTGTVVLFDHVPGKLHVVVSTYPNGTYRLFDLGGSDRYWKHVSRARLTVISIDRITVSDEKK